MSGAWASHVEPNVLSVAKRQPCNLQNAAILPVPCLSPARPCPCLLPSHVPHLPAPGWSLSATCQGCWTRWHLRLADMGFLGKSWWFLGPKSVDCGGGSGAGCCPLRAWHFIDTQSELRAGTAECTRSTCQCVRVCKCETGS